MSESQEGLLRGYRKIIAMRDTPPLHSFKQCFYKKLFKNGCELLWG